jgi:nucleotide-binding universal stress UspA family protein
MDAELNQRVLKLSDAISSYHDGQLSAIHTWSIWNEQMLKGRLGQEQFEEIERNTEKAVQEKFHSFIASNTEAPVSSNVIKGDPEEAITQFTQAKNVDLVVMGTVARSGIAGIVTGNSAEQILSNLQCSVLALKPSNFSSPIQVE